MAAIGTHAPGGLAIDQLLKLVASGRITAEKYAELTGDIPGANAEIPVFLDEAAAPNVQGQVAQRHARRAPFTLRIFTRISKQ